MDREEMIRTLAEAQAAIELNQEYVGIGTVLPIEAEIAAASVVVSRVLATIDAVFGEGWFIGTPTDTAALRAVDAMSVTADALSTGEPMSFNTFAERETAYYRAAEKVVAAGRARRVALNGTAAGSEATENKP